MLFGFMRALCGGPNVVRRALGDGAAVVHGPIEPEVISMASGIPTALHIHMPHGATTLDTAMHAARRCTWAAEPCVGTLNEARGATERGGSGLQ